MHVVGYSTQMVAHIVMKYSRFIVPHNFDGLCHLDPETINWLRELPIELLYNKFDLICIQLYICIYILYLNLLPLLYHKLLHVPQKQYPQQKQ